MDKKPKKTKKFKLDPKKWGIDFNKNEYYEIVESNSARPERVSESEAKPKFI